MLLYAITDRDRLHGNDDNARRASLVSLAAQWAERHIDYIQIREKDLDPPALLTLTRQIVSAVRKESQTVRVLLNGPAHIAIEADADGVHLPAGSPPGAAHDARLLFASAGVDAILSYACHSHAEVLKAKEESQHNPYATVNNTLILYAPVFEKTIHGETLLPGLGLESLHAAAEAARPIPLLALGGITRENSPACLAAGAAGIAAIRFFLNNDWHSLKSPNSDE
ncbi:MAG TPA: thiamine phosphate synthase [Acidobacteriaceae bacterium]|jgi:thiamine-phosphate pyrophosphorylase|nr:thiamine phosphate synthase [Acidobacteriaceae bacterium]